MAEFWRRGVRLATRAAIAFGISTAAAIGVGAAVTDNAFVQIVVTVLAALAFWLPFLIVLVGIERFFTRSRAFRPGRDSTSRGIDDEADRSWRRLCAAAPVHAERVAVLRRSLGRSRLALGQAELDFDAHELCVLIDRRLPELIDRELDGLPPDDRNRSRQVGELLDLIEQFARHCSRNRSSEGTTAPYGAEVLRRRFEARLSGH